MGLIISGAFLLILSAIGSLVFSFPSDMKINESEFEGKNAWQRLNKKGKKYAIFSILVLALSEYILISKGLDDLTPKTVSKPEKDVVFIAKNQKETTKIIKYLPSNKTINNPYMAVWRDSTGFATIKNTLYVRICFKCINNAIAYHIKSSLISLSLKNGKVNLIGALSPKVANENISSFGNQYAYIGRAVVLPTQLGSHIDTTYYFFKGDYFTQEIGGAKKTLRELFYTIPKELPITPSNIKLEQVDDQEIYQAIKEYLISKRYW